MSIGTYFFLIIYIYFKIENMWQYLVYIFSPSLSTIHDGKLRIIKYSFYPQHTFLSSHTFLPDITFHSFSYNYVNGNQGCLFRQYKIHTNHSMVNRCKSTIFINILKNICERHNYSKVYITVILAHFLLPALQQWFQNESIIS